MTKKLFHTFIKVFPLFILLFSSEYSYATHNRSGQITYEHLYGNTYKFTVTTCTKSSSEADRPSLEIKWGDGTQDTIDRDHIDFVAGYDAQKNYYYGTHTYAGPGDFLVSVEDPNRNSGVLNITNSVNVPFCIQTKIIISPFVGDNDSPIFSYCPCPEYGCVNQPYYYNVGVYDPNGDSLSYELVPCKGLDCADLAIPADYRYPNNVGGGALSIDAQTGLLSWISPTITGEYNFAILVTEWRAGVKISVILHDLQVTIKNCSNFPPIIPPVADTCVFVGDTLLKTISAIDTNFNSGGSNMVTIEGEGEPFEVTPNTATFNIDGTTQTPTFTEGEFEWIPGCENIRNNPYRVFFTSQDNDPSITSRNLFIWNITVKGPPPENLVVTPQGSALGLTWDPPSYCNNISGYKIYMNTDSVANDIACCPDGGPTQLGYMLIGETSGVNSTSFTTGNLVIGNEYCFMITAIYENGTESCPSIPDCSELLFEVPVMTNVSVVTTDATNGQDTVIWATPKELQSGIFPPPYHYKVYRNNGLNPNNPQLILTTPDRPSLANNDTLLLDGPINTVATGHTYNVDLYSNGNLVGSATPASSIFLTLTPNDNQIGLSWDLNVPWTNSTYEVYRETTSGSGVFNLIATTTETSYIDDSLINLKEYCYKVKSIGEYTSTGIVTPLINWSQEVCAEPYDYTPPCPPSLSIEGFCEEEYNNLNWTNPNNDCADDAVAYNLYYTPVEGGEFEIIQTFSSDSDTSFVFENMGTIAGCYYVTAIDSIPYNNESEPSEIVCMDNCPVYELPNVFTPNGDGDNDLFHALLPYRYIESVKFTAFDRWGVEMYYTEDPDINWDGTYQKNGEPLPDGVYFYVCEVNTIRLSGIETITLQGFIHLINE